jgi:hypothetical protein
LDPVTSTPAPADPPLEATHWRSIVLVEVKDGNVVQLTEEPETVICKIPAQVDAEFAKLHGLAVVP